MLTLNYYNSNLIFSSCEVRTLGLISHIPHLKCEYNNIINRRTYCSTTSTDAAETALVVVDNLESAPSDKCLYSNIITVENLELGLKRTKSNVSAGLDGETKANYINSDKLQKLSIRLKQHKYQPSPSKKV